MAQVTNNDAKMGKVPAAIVPVALYGMPYRIDEIQSSRFQVSGGEAICQTSGSSVAYINGVSEALFKVGMCLPAGPYVSDEDVKYIVDTIKANIIG